MKKRVSVTLEEETLGVLRAEAKAKGIAMTELIAQLAQPLVDAEREKKREAKRKERFAPDWRPDTIPSYSAFHPSRDHFGGTRTRSSSPNWTGTPSDGSDGGKMPLY